MKQLRILIVDDSALVRQVLSSIINSQADMHVVATASNPVAARDILLTTQADVMTLDIEMPGMNGIEFLERLMAARPMPVVMVSSLTEKGSQMTLKALELGAIDFVAKPRLGVAESLQAYSQDICARLRVAASARMPRRVQRTASHNGHPAQLPLGGPYPNRVILVGSSTGGTEAVRTFLSMLPRDCPPVLIAQHMPENFTRSFAQRLDSTTHFDVCEAGDGQLLAPGKVFVAPGHSHLLLQGRAGAYRTRLSKADPVNRHRPSVDVLFHSGAQSAGADALGVILTGMGKDGAAGMLAMHNAGARTFAQDEKSCVVFGMPREAIALGGVDEVVALQDLARSVVETLQR